MNYLVSSAFVVLLVGCSAKELNPGAQTVIITNTPPSKDCQYLGEVSGSQGNLLTADITPDRELIQGARNEMRNQAHSMGANYVIIVNESTSVNQGQGGAYNATIFGNAFKCP